MCFTFRFLSTTRGKSVWVDIELKLQVVLRAFPHERHRKFHNFLQHGTLPKKSLLFLVFLLILWDFQALMPGSPELHLLCHVTLLCCQVDPEARSKAKSEAKKSLLPLPILSLMWQPLAHLNQCYSSNSLPFLPCGSALRLCGNMLVL